MDELYKKLKMYGPVKAGALISHYTTFRVGGPARFLVETSETGRISELLNWLSAEGMPYFILGGGSNTLWMDQEFDGVVIKMANKKIAINDGVIETEAGAPLAVVVTAALQAGLSGLEWAAGVPGTVGGAVRGNAGAMESDTAHSLLQVEVWRDGEIIELQPQECAFGYRDSIFKHNSDVILRAWYKTTPGIKNQMMQKIQGYIKQRNGKYPAFPSAGSFFKNIDFSAWPGSITDLPEHFKAKAQVPAGWINEQNGLKGFMIGGAMVSQEHGNFLINYDKATERDVLAVVEEVEQRAYTTFKVQLEPEVCIIKKIV